MKPIRNKLHVAYGFVGRLLDFVTRPLLRIYFRRTKRAYLVVLKDKDVLLLKNWLSDGKWALPGGGLSKLESAEAAVLREVEEELNLRLTKNDLRLLLNGKWQTHGYNFYYSVFVTTAQIDHFVIRGLEITDARWVKLEDLNENNASADMLMIAKKLKTLTDRAH